MKIPEVRDKLRAIADTIYRAGFTRWAGELRRLESELYRRRALKSHRTVSASITDHMRRTIRKIKRRRPSITYQEISEITGVNIGRVSEILRGKRR